MRARSVLLAAALALLLPAPAARAADELLGVCGKDLCVAAPGGAPAALTTDGAVNAYAAPTASRDGAAIHYVRNDGLWRAGARNAAPERLFETDGGRDSALSPSGASFAYRTFDGRVGPFGYRVESSLRIGGATGSGLWTSDSEVAYAGWLGEQLIIAQRNGGTLAVGCQVATIPSGPPPCGPVVAQDPAREVGRLTGSPDAKLVAAEVATVDGNLQTPDPTVIALFDAATGALARDLTSGPTDVNPAFAADGSRVYFTRGADTLSVPLAGGAPQVAAAGMTDAVAYGVPDATPAPGPGGPAQPGGATARPKAPKGRLRVAKRRVSLTVRCGAAACARTTWTFTQRRTTRLKVVVPALAANAKKTLKVKLPMATAKRIGRKGLELRLTGKGLKPRTVRLVRR